MDARPPQTPASASKPSASRFHLESNEEFVRGSNAFLNRTPPQVEPVADKGGPSTTPSKSRQSTLSAWQKTALPTPTSKGKERATEVPSSRKTIARPGPRQSQDYQADADEVERARDEADPDFYTSPTPQSRPDTRKRKRLPASQIQTVPPSPKQSKPSRSKHVAYEKCKSETQQERDEHIRRITENWPADSASWIPEAFVPSRLVKGGKGRGVMRALEPRDWNTLVLKELAYLSSMTRGSPKKASEMLYEAVTREDRRGGGPQILHTDVAFVIRQCEQDDGGAESLNDDGDLFTSSRVLTPKDGGDDIVGQRSPHDNDEGIPEVVCTSPAARSSTFVRDDPAIKQEMPSLSSRPSSSSQGRLEEWSYDGDMERLRESELRMAVRKAEADAKSAELEVFMLRRQMAERMRERGIRSDDAIAL